MTILTKYIVKQHSLLLLMTLGIGIGIYLIIDFVEKADSFLEFEGGASHIIPYYLAKLPGIISQILPAVFLLACVILLCVMSASREIVALKAGGISNFVLVRVLMACGIFWAITQFFCAQILVSKTEQQAEKIWDIDVRKRTVSEKILKDIWFIDGNYIVNLGKVSEKGLGEDILIYQLDKDSKEIYTIINAKNFQTKDTVWTLKNLTITNPSEFNTINISEAELIIDQNINYFFVNEEDKPQFLDFVLLGQAIDRLKNSGSNVEQLETIWYGKISYAISIIVFAFVSIAIVSYKSNAYLAVILSVGTAFLTYLLNNLGEGLGENGTLPPIVGAFLAQFIMFCLSLTRIIYTNKKN